MKNRQPYMHVAVVLRNLLTNGEKFEADHLKAICLFFEGCLDANKDDANAMRLLGKILDSLEMTDLDFQSNSLIQLIHIRLVLIRIFTVTLKAL